MHTAWEYPGWVDVVPQLDHLKVATFSFMDQRPKSNANKPDKDTLELFISTISRIKATHLHLHNLSLSYDTPEKDIPRTYHLDPANMNLHNVSGPFLYEFVRWMDRHEIVGKVRISDSIMSPQPTIPVPIAGESLELYNIPTSASMVAILGMFNTSILQVSACPGFDDAVVRWLTQKDAVPGLSGKNFAMDTMERLEIVESINFGSYDMRRLVQTRARAADERIQADPTSNGVVPIEYLLVSGDCPVLSVSDMDWYRKNSDIVEVSWIREWDGGNKMEIFDNFDDLDDYSDD
jgi:hypothetical protein